MANSIFPFCQLSFFWTGIAGLVVTTLVGIFFWETMNSKDWMWMCLLCVTGAFGHFLLIKCYEVAEGHTMQIKLQSIMEKLRIH